jgi:hypothetical protein
MSIQQHLKNLNTWKRGFFILLFALIFTVAEVIAWAAALFQFVTLLLTGETNPRLSNLGQRLGTYIYQILLYITFKSDAKPFPFSEWPSGPPAAE